MLTVKISKSDFKSPQKWAEITAAMELPAGRTEAIVTRIPGLLPVEEALPIQNNAQRPPAWLLADNIDGQWWLIHTASPRFICRVTDEEEDCGLSPFEYETGDGQRLCHFIWQDCPPEDITAMLNEAEDFLADYDDRSGCVDDDD